MEFTPQTWPGRVIPADQEQAALATRKLFAEVFPGHPVTSQAMSILNRWYGAGWCVDAIKVALDNLPEGREGYQPRRGAQESPEDYLVRRLRAWFREADDDVDFERNARLAPPRSGQSLEMHLRRKQQRQLNDGIGTRPRNLTEAGQQARRQVRDRARQGRKDPIAQARERDARLRAALDALDAGTPPAHRAEFSAAGGESRPITADAEHAATLRHDPTVRRILDRLAEENRRPTDQETTILRRAMRTAQQQAGLDTLDPTR